MINNIASFKISIEIHFVNSEKNLIEFLFESFSNISKRRPRPVFKNSNPLESNEGLAPAPRKETSEDKLKNSSPKTERKNDGRKGKLSFLSNVLLILHPVYNGF